MAGPPPLAVHLGEIHTGVLQSSSPISAELARSVLAALPHQAVRTWERPIRQAASPEVLTGLDHPLPSASGAQVRGVGTLATELRVTAGRLLQAATRTTVIGAGVPRRLRWSHYLARPAVVEAIGRPVPQDLVDGFLREESRTGFDLGPVCAHWMGWAQSCADLDHRAPFPARRIRLRWAAVPAGPQAPARISFRVHGDDLRTLRIVVPAELAAGLPELCRDLALHDWLLSSLVSVIDTAGIGSREREDVVRRLHPAVDHLLHAWMPAARFPAELAPYWDAVEQRSGLTRQWENAVRQVRDQIALAAATRATAVPAVPAGPATAKAGPVAGPGRAEARTS